MNAPRENRSAMLDVPQPIVGLLAALRRRIRWYVWIEGLTLAVAWLGLAFWISLAIDWVPVTFGHDEPTRPLRVAILSVAVVVLAGLLFWYIVRRAFVSFRDRSMAVVLERTFRDFDDSLLTTVEMAQQPEHAATFNRDMLQRTCAQALAKAGHVQLTRVFNPLPLWRNGLLAAALTGSVIAFAVLVPQAFATWARRMLLLEDLRWERRHHVAIDEDRVIKVGRGSNVTVHASAFDHVWQPDPSAPDRTQRVPKQLPDVVRIYYSMQGTTVSETMVREGAPQDGRQHYTHTFQGLPDSVDYYIIGGDHRVEGYRIEVVDNPTAELALYCEYPPYMVDTEHNLYTPREIPVSGAMQLPQGTRVTVRARANKPLVSALVHRVGSEPSGPLAAADGNLLSRRGDSYFEYVLESLPPETVQLEFLLLDTDGIRSPQPVRLSLQGVVDEPPHLDVRLRGIGEAVTPSVFIPLAGTMTDDYGIRRLSWTFQIIDGDQRRPELKLPLARDPQGRRNLVFDKDSPPEILDPRELHREYLRQQGKDPSQTSHAPTPQVPLLPADDDEQPARQGPTPPASGPLSPFELRPGNRVLLMVHAYDGREIRLPIAPHFDALRHAFPAAGDVLVHAWAIGSGDAAGTTVRILGPNRGQSQPFSLEVVTPERFRAILAKKELNLRKRFEDIIGEVLATRRSLVEWVTAPGAGTPRESENGPPPISPQTLVLQLRQNSSKNAGEVEGVAIGFDEITEEFRTNRLDDFTELEQRLQGAIARPLHHVAGPMFDQLDARLAALEQAVRSGTSLEQPLLEAQLQIDQVLAAMERILNSMLELESYEEAIALIQEIIELQTEILERTQKHRTQILLNPNP
jgi:hypothetical protein